MRNFDRDNRNDTRGPRFEKRGFGGPKKFGGDRERSFDKPRFGGNDRGGFGGKPMMHEAVCSECGNRCQVPFKPNGRKPIFCSTCFETQGGAKSNERTFDRPRFGGREERSFGGNDRGSEKVNENLKEQLAEVNAKLDRILKMLGNTDSVKKPKEKISFDNGLDFGEPIVETEDTEEIEEMEATPKKTKAKTAKAFPNKAGKKKK